jgi:hypothetical protein
MSVRQFLADTAERGIYICVEEGKIKIRADKGAFAARAEVQAYKADILAYFAKDNNQARFNLTTVATDVAKPASFAQQRLWLVDRIGGGSPQYNMPVGLRLKGAFAHDAFAEALQKLIWRHEVLRTNFEESGGTLFQRVQSEFDLPISRVNLVGLNPAQQMSEFKRIAAQALSSSCDLASDLMLWVKFFELSSHEHLVLFNVHHIASDGWSMNILINEITALYHSFLEGKADNLAALPFQYADYAYCQREWFTGDVLDEQRDYWLKQLRDLPQVHQLSLDNPRLTTPRLAGGTHNKTLDASLTATLKTMADEHQVTLFVLLESVFAILIIK